jgi:predicted dehydrogenase
MMPSPGTNTTHPSATATPNRHIRFGLIGYGYWGPLLLRNLARLDNAEIALVADLAEKRLAEAARNNPGVRVSSDIDDAFADVIDAVVIATPLRTHFDLARRALASGKHVLVEKPLTDNEAEARELIALARQHERILMVGHTFEYSPEVERLRDIVQGGELGDIYYVHSSRLNLGIFRRDADVIWDLAPHDVSMINFILGSYPIAVSANGATCVHSELIDVAHLNLRYPTGQMAHVHISWLHPNKERRLTIVGKDKMAIYDDTAGNEKIKIYDRGVEGPSYATTFGEFQLSYRYGDIHIPYVTGAEPLAVECQHFASAIRTGEPPRSDGEVGLRVVKTLEYAHTSIRNGGTSVDIPW